MTSNLSLAINLLFHVDFWNIQENSEEAVVERSITLDLSSLGKFVSCNFLSMHLVAGSDRRFKKPVLPLNILVFFTVLV